MAHHKHRAEPSGITESLSSFIMLHILLILNTSTCITKHTSLQHGKHPLTLWKVSLCYFRRTNFPADAFSHVTLITTPAMQSVHLSYHKSYFICIPLAPAPAIADTDSAADESYRKACFQSPPVQEMADAQTVRRHSPVLPLQTQAPG